MIIDHPAAVFFRHGMLDVKASAGNENGSAEKILNPFHIPIISSSNGKMEFIKSNGDKVRLDISKLPSRYDVVLFNAVNDPVPCYFKDLRKAAADYFADKTSARRVMEKTGESIVPADQFVPDTSGQIRSAFMIHARAQKGRNIRPFLLLVPVMWSYLIVYPMFL